MSYNYAGSTASSGSYFAISHAGQGNTLVIADSDRIGIGTATPQAKLHVVGGIIGNGTIPVGGIIMWSGSIASIPTGWALCDGSNGTPNLRDRFVVGAGNVYSVAATGGSADAIVVSHSHTMQTGGSHDHTFGFSVGSFNNFALQVISERYVNPNGSTTTSTHAGHTHTIDSAGSSGTNANLPPYYALAFIMRTV
jgi:microcystin-dependent protein